MYTAVVVALFIALIVMGCKFVRWLWSHECVVGVHPNGRCCICGGSMAEQDNRLVP